ncbi:hypothetical protein [Photorhabdus luminescens]|uniref:Uncharacterized protein n=1 Tax=Photorhabdus luminescens subsp. sonorensis TaxID=1173677 RepID=A0A5C4RIK7_PHOLU|nr:hypothetical protein [Photorhabdus luminescens]MCW7762235.1 hypothetical protein [Photorhabdus luminescens subsp. venezuelensis]TNH43614.1 hypothetical protein EP164_10735 [Photorhabdus luminescens subsp. sonorensis]
MHHTFVIIDFQPFRSPYLDSAQTSQHQQACSNLGNTASAITGSGIHTMAPVHQPLSEESVFTWGLSIFQLDP